METKIIKFAGVALLVSVSGYLIYSLGKKLSASYKEAEEKRKLEEAEAEKKRIKWMRARDKFDSQFDDPRIASVTLSSKKIKKEDRSYVYDVLNKLKTDAMRPVPVGQDFEDGYSYKKFIDLHNFLRDAESDAIEARIQSLKVKDVEDAARIARDRQIADEERKHRHEMDILEEKRKAEVEELKAKINMQKIKYDSISKALRNSDNKSIQSKLNINTDLED